jgi:hypothetical protein
MGFPRRLRGLALLVCSSGLSASVAAAQVTVLPPADSTPTRITQLAAATTGVISGVVLDERGIPLDGVVVSAMGGSTAFAVSDRAGQFALQSLMPGPYLVRAHLEGYLPARSTIINVRPSAREVSTFTLRREGKAVQPRVALAGAGSTEVVAAPLDESEEDREETETTWRLRHLRRSILKNATDLAQIPTDNQDWFLTDSLQLIGRAVESSARMAGALFAHSPLEGQVNLLTTGAFDAPGELLSLDRTRGVTYFAVGAPVGARGDWTVKAALNQGDLSSWIITGNYVTRRPAQHGYQFGMSYGLHRYDRGNAIALAAMSEAARSVGAMYAYDDWAITDRVSIGYGAHYAHYDYLAGDTEHLSPRVSASFEPVDTIRIRAVATRQVVAPGAEEFLPPAGAQVLPPQRTFSPLTTRGFRPEDLQHYEIGVERMFDGATVGVRVFDQRVDEQLVTVFGMRSPGASEADIGHYYVGNAGDVDLRGWGITFSHALAANVRGSFDYSLSDADWGNGGSLDRERLARIMPSALRNTFERVHDFTTTLETELPSSATRVFVLYKLNSAYIRADGSESRPGLDARWDVQVSQALPFMNFMSAEWEMLIAVRNLFRESFAETSIYDELLVARPPKRLVGGITVKF